MTHTLYIGLVLILAGLVGVIKGALDMKKSKNLTSCPANELKTRDVQYLVVSSVALLSGLALIGMRHKNEIRSLF